ncbi:MAG: helix-turn-helix transcriptional regulator [Candidatus Spechtbacterales bacterium]
MKTKNRIPKEMLLLAEYLRRIRTDLGLSMHEVARRTNLTPSYISKMESGNTFQTISAHGLVEFSKCYNIPIAFIMEKAGFVPESEDDLPGLASYLRLKYKAPHQATQEMEIAWDIIKKKYQIL